ncbi:hypothetical protein AURDEDRAFT_162203 [Auricularia subglabra TFB-10046 SS5]|nr:hypothetical protein AURDEDRAFT_162203 [Auricularia subglabra TFB-10046 SS5]
MRLLRTFLVLASIASRAVVSAAPAHATREAVNPNCGDDFCAGANNTDPKYFCGDYRLGPKKLPTRLPLDNIVYKYDRLGGLCPAEFLKTYTDASGFFKYPSFDGFQLDVHGEPINGTVQLEPGMLIDRFGRETGKFFAPAWTPYIQRSLPPLNLDTPDGDVTFPFNYHVYEVVKPFNVTSGPIAPAFGQPGQGVQYQTVASAADLVAQGFLKRVNNAHYK